MNIIYIMTISCCSPSNKNHSFWYIYRNICTVFNTYGNHITIICCKRCIVIYCSSTSRIFVILECMFICSPYCIVYIINKQYFRRIYFISCIRIFCPSSKLISSSDRSVIYVAKACNKFCCCTVVISISCLCNLIIRELTTISIK